MNTIVINGQKFVLCDVPLKVKKDGMLLIYVKKPKKKINDDGTIKHWTVTGIYTAPSRRWTDIIVGGITYKCRDMKPEQVSILKNHLETTLALADL